MKKDNVRLIIDFKNRETMFDWIEQIKAFQAMNTEAQPYDMNEIDIDIDKSTIKQGNTYIMLTKKDIIQPSKKTRMKH